MTVAGWNRFWSDIWGGVKSVGKWAGDLVGGIVHTGTNVVTKVADTGTKVLEKGVDTVANIGNSVLWIGGFAIGGILLFGLMNPKETAGMVRDTTGAVARVAI